MDNETHVLVGEAQRRIESTPTHPIELPTERGSFHLDQAVKEAFPVRGSKLLHSIHYAESLRASTAKLVLELPGGKTESYFLKVLYGESAAKKCEGEFESLSAIHAVSPGFVPQPYAWGRYVNNEVEAAFILEEYREIREQPADPQKLPTRLATLHHDSLSPTGKFGFHVKTWHGDIEQSVDQWEESWATFFGRHLGHFMNVAKPILNWPEFDVACKLTLFKVVPQLLLPLQENSRILKPSLVHGDCWDGNTAMDAEDGEAFVFDVCSFYGHNEYDVGNWRTPRHRLSGKKYVLAYKREFPVSEPVEGWTARNLLYSLPFNLGNLINIPGSQQKDIVYEDMMTLCKTYCPVDLEIEMARL